MKLHENIAGDYIVWIVERLLVRYSERAPGKDLKVRGRAAYRSFFGRRSHMNLHENIAGEDHVWTLATPCELFGVRTW
jgi:hypothetical protein